MSNNTADRVKTIVSESMSIEANHITEETTFADLDTDSLDHLEIVMRLEEEFSCEISDAAVEKIVTVGDAIQLVESIAAAGGGA